jgi:hypothetical protein
MKRITLSIRIAAAVGPALLGMVPAFAHAGAIEEQLNCKSSGHAFIMPLLQSGEIESKPMRVESNSVNAFRPAHGVHLTAFDYRVYAVLGFQKDDPIFKPGSGEPIGDSAYGVVVIGPTEDVEDKVHQTGSTAVVRHVTPLITAIICKSP